MLQGWHSTVRGGERHLEAGVGGAGGGGGAVEPVLERRVVATVQLIQDRPRIVLQPGREKHHLCVQRNQGEPVSQLCLVLHLPSACC